MNKKEINMNFIPGIELNRDYYSEIIKPLLEKQFPELKYSAALIGYGSDVLGLDNKTSMDHNWGPRCVLFIDKQNYHLKEEIDIFLKYNLPFEFRSFSTNYSDPRYDQTQKMIFTKSYPINHLIDIYEVEEYFQSQLSVKNLDNVSLLEWLTFNDQILIELTSGEIFYDGLQKLTKLQENLRFYPTDILRLKLASLWLSISNEEAFIGRCIELNDSIGLKLIISRIVSSIMKISFYLDYKYIPYSKWFGSLFEKTSNAKVLSPKIQSLLGENDKSKVQEKICDLYENLILLHNKRNKLPTIENKIQGYFGRPYKVIFAETIVEKLMNSIEEQSLKKIDLNKVALDIKLESIDFTEF